MSGSDKSRMASPHAIFLAEEERIAAKEAERLAAELRLANRPRRSSAEVQAEREARAKASAQTKPERAAERKRQRQAKAERKFQRENAPRLVEAIADRLEARSARADADRRAAKAARKAKSASGDHGPQIVPGTKTVDDPMQPGQKLKATVNLAEHPLEMMLARQRLTQAQYEAGIRFRAIYEHAMIGPGRGIDPGKIKVDGGKLGDPLSDAVLHAHYELRRILPRLGKIGFDIAVKVCGQGLAVRELARRWPGGDSEKLKAAFLGPRLKETLDVLAEEVWGAKGPEHGRIAGVRDLGSSDIDV